MRPAVALGRRLHVVASTIVHGLAGSANATRVQVCGWLSFSLARLPRLANTASKPPKLSRNSQRTQLCQDSAKHERFQAWQRAARRRAPPRRWCSRDAAIAGLPGAAAAESRGLRSGWRRGCLRRLRSGSKADQAFRGSLCNPFVTLQAYAQYASTTPAAYRSLLPPTTCYLPLTPYAAGEAMECPLPPARGRGAIRHAYPRPPHH